MSHRKHTKLTKPFGGNWGRNEISILGAPCGEIKKLTAEITEGLAKTWNIVYVDAMHNSSETNDWSALDYGAQAQFTNKISHSCVEYSNVATHFFNDADLVIVNGNHFEAQSQIAWIHEKKSLEKKLDKLNNLGLVILDNRDLEIPQFLAPMLLEKDVKTVYRDDLESILAFFTSKLEDAKPILNGLVLVGGKSSRMKKDKSNIVYSNNLPQHEFTKQLLENFCSTVYVSVRDEAQAGDFDGKAIVDKFTGLGPYGGILSAFQHDPNSAWLVVAVDLPYLDEATLTTLVSGRNTAKLATSFIDPKNKFPEPLITIWEPRAYPVLLEFLSKGYSCPRKALINSDVEIIVDRDVKALTNVNTPEELADVLTKDDA